MVLAAERVLCINTTSDELVPAKSNYLAGAKQITFAMPGHLNFQAFSAKAFKETTAFLEK